MPVQFGKTFNNALSLSQCSFNWDIKSFQLKNINFTVSKGSFVGITGKVGSGKSTLLAGILAEIYKVEGMIASFNTRDGKVYRIIYCLLFNNIRNEYLFFLSRICTLILLIFLGFAFVAQTPWIQKGTIKDNILFGQNYNLERYKYYLLILNVLYYFIY